MEYEDFECCNCFDYGFTTREDDVEILCKCCYDSDDESDDLYLPSETDESEDYTTDEDDDHDL